MKKLRECGGESLIEVIVSILVICMGLQLLAGAIVATAKVNRAGDMEHMRSAANFVSTGSNGKVDIFLGSDAQAAYPVTIPVTVYKSAAEGAVKDEDSVDSSGTRVLYYYTYVS